MRTNMQTVALIGFAALAATATPLRAADPPTPRHAPDYCMLSDIVGSKVRMLPGAKDVVDATKEDKKVELPTGKVKDLLIDTCNGATAWSIVKFDQTLGFGGKTVVVPGDLLTWNAKEKTFDLAQSEDQLKALPEFDVDAAKKDGIDATMVTLTSYWPSIVFGHKHDDAADETAGDHAKEEGIKNSSDVLEKCPAFLIGKRECSCATPQLVLATDISGCTLHTTDGEFGKVTTNLMDRANRKLALVVVTHGAKLGVGGTDYLVPLDAVCLHENDEGRAYCVKFTTKQIESGVKYEKPDEGAVKAEDARRAKEYFSELAEHDDEHR
jgi:hypothetical protein